MSKLFINEIRPEQEINSIFALAEKELRAARNGRTFLRVKLVDRTGEITGNMWDNAQQASAAVSAGTVVQVCGRGELYKDNLQLNLREIVSVPVDQSDPSDFLPICPLDREELFLRLRGQAAEISRKPLLQLMRLIFTDPEIRRQFMNAPAAKSMHHAYIGGLLEHSVAVTANVMRICEEYPFLDRDLLIAGAILHDIGKIREFDYDLFIDYSHSGRLVGHIVLGVQIVEEKIRSAEQFPDSDALLLKHLILSHHGEREFGAVALPMTREAFVLHFADDLDAKMNGISGFLSDGENPADLWTAYHRVYGRYLFKGFPVELENSGDRQAPMPQDTSSRGTPAR